MQDSIRCYRRIILWFLTIIHFYIDAQDKVFEWIDEKINNRIEDQVVYYGLYNKSEKFYACLYDHRSFWDRLYMAIPTFIKPKYNTFTMDDIQRNLPDVFDFLDAAIIVYARDGKLIKRLLTKENYQSTCHKNVFGYAIVEDENSVEIDITSVMNEFGVCHSLQCGDLVRIFSKLISARTFDINKIKALKCMKVASFEDELFKEEDIVFSNDRNQ
jgi:hypothetical protein